MWEAATGERDEILPETMNQLSKQLSCCSSSWKQQSQSKLIETFTDAVELHLLLKHAVKEIWNKLNPQTITNRQYCTPMKKNKKCFTCRVLSHKSKVLKWGKTLWIQETRCWLTGPNTTTAPLQWPPKNKRSIWPILYTSCHTAQRTDGVLDSLHGHKDTKTPLPFQMQ